MVSQKHFRTLTFLALVVVLLLLMGLPQGASGSDTRQQAAPENDLASRFQTLQRPDRYTLDWVGITLKKAPERRPETALPEMVDGQKTFTSIADAITAQGFPTEVVGDTIDMWAGYDVIYNVLEVNSLVQFDIAALPAGMKISKATLRLSLISSGDTPGTSRLIRVHRITENWNEGTVNWNNRPMRGEAYGFTTVGHGVWGWYEFNVTNLVQRWYDGSYTNHGLEVIGPDSSASNPGWRGFSTREGPDHPQLVVEYEAKPQGAAVFLPVVLAPPAAPGAAPVLNPINNADGDGSYQVSWQVGPGAFTYVLEEDDNAAFSSPVVAYDGPSTSWNATGKGAGTYYYRVKSKNPAGASPWSNVQSVKVVPPPDHYVGSSPNVSFDVMGQEVCNFEIRVPFSTGSCTISAKPGICYVIENKSFKIEEDHPAFGKVVVIKGDFSSDWSKTDGTYSVSLCGNQLIIPPSSGDWDATKQ